MDLQKPNGRNSVSAKMAVATPPSLATGIEGRTSSTTRPGPRLAVAAILPKRRLLSKTPGRSSFMQTEDDSLGQSAADG